MNANLMRLVDRVAGPPLCLGLTCWDKLLQVAGPGKKGCAPPKRILFIELAETGGLVVAWPAVQQARRLFPQAEMHFMTFSLGKELLELLGFAPERQVIIRTSSLGVFARDTLAALREIRARRFDAVVNLEAFARYSTAMAYLSGAPLRCGYHRFYEEGHYTGDLLTHRVVYNPHIHAAQSFIALVQALTKPAQREPLLKEEVNDFDLDTPLAQSSSQDKERMLARLQQQQPEFTPDKHKLVLLNPNASDLVTARRWPDAHFLTLASELLKDPTVYIAFTGAPSERDAVSQLAHRLPQERVLHMAGETATLKELIDLFNLSRLLVTNDSGPAHFASLTQLPVIVLFGPETPEVYGPLGPEVEAVTLGLSCSPCVSVYNQKRTACSDNQCLKRISPDLVVQKAREKLGA